MLTRPELAILMAYSKMQVYQALLESDLPGRPAMHDRLAGYFPPSVAAEYAEQLPRHPLAREITATVLTNEIVGQAGAAFLNQLVTRTGAGLAAAAEAYLVFDAALAAAPLRQAICSLGHDLPADEQYRLLAGIEELLGTMCEWALERGLPVTAEAGTLERYRRQVDLYLKSLGGLLPEADWHSCRQQAERLQQAGLSAESAQRLAGLAWFENFLPLVELLETSGGDFYSVAHTFNEVRAQLGIDALVAALGEVVLRDRWDRLARQALVAAFHRGGFRITRVILADHAGNPEAFFASRRGAFRAYQGLREALRGNLPANFHPFTVLSRSLEALAEESHSQEKPR